MWIDIVLVALFILIALDGARKGFVSNFVRLIGWIVSVGCAIFFWEPVRDYLNKAFELQPAIAKIIGDKLDIFSSSEGSLSSTAEAGAVLNFPERISAFLQEKVSEMGGLMADGVAEVAADVSMKIIAFLVILICVKIVLSIIIFMFDKARHLPVIGPINRFLGFLVGLIKGGIIVSILLLVLVPVFAVTDNELLANTYKDAKLTQYLYENNPIIMVWDDFDKKDSKG